MSGGTRIIAIETSGQQMAAGDEFLLTQEASAPIADEAAWDEAIDPAEEPAPRRFDWLAPGLAVLAVAGWSVFFGYARQGELFAPASLAAVSSLIADWAMPVLLIAVGWLITMRHSRRESVRFGNVARMLSDESARLENRLTAVNRELSLGREFIAAQSRDLESLGRIATERLSHNADRLQELIRDNGGRIDAIADVSQAALDNMEKLRGQMPVLANSAKDVSNNIAAAGRTAHAQIEDLSLGFMRISESGEASEKQVVALRSQVDGALAEFSGHSEMLAQITAARFAELTEHSGEFRSTLDSHEQEALAAIRTRAAAMAEEVELTRQLLDSQEAESLTSLRARVSALRDEGGAVSRALREGEGRALDSWQAAIARLEQSHGETIARVEDSDSGAMEAARARMQAIVAETDRFDAALLDRNRSISAEMADRRSAAESRDDAALTALAERLRVLDQDVAIRQSAQAEHVAAIASRTDAIGDRLAEFDRNMADIAAHGGEAEASVARTVQALAQHLGSSRAALNGAGSELSALTDASVRLLELIQASVDHSRDELPRALAAGEQTLGSFEARIVALRDAASVACGQGESLAALVETSYISLDKLSSGIGGLQARLAEAGGSHAGLLDGLRARLDAIEAQNARIAEAARAELTAAVETLTGAAQAAVSELGESGARSVSQLAAQMGSESAAAIEKAIRGSVAETTTQLQAAAEQAAGIGREAAVLLRDQLAAVNELTGNLERRVAHTRQRAQEQVDNGFSRRAALITESLNSNAIDIAKALSSEVSDTAWAAYLRGDRGIFTRRAVSIIDGSDARAIAHVYENDGDFREHVSRYIHDFEAILRQVLSTRDGQALGVTLLSSDMGKLYVALAQAIERLRS